MLNSVESSLIDRFFIASKEDPPWTVHAEAVLSATPDPGDVESAARTVLRANPLLTARLDTYSRRSWIVDNCVIEADSPIVRMVESGNDPQRLRAALVSKPFDLTTELPVRFYFEMLVSECRLFIVGHHAVLDGIGVQAVMNAWIRSCVASNVSLMVGWQEAHAIPFVPSSSEREAAVVDRLRVQSRGDVVRLANRVNTVASGYGVAYNYLPALTVDGSSVAGMGATQNDLAVAAVAAAAIQWNMRCGEPALPMNIGVPINLRQPRSWAEGAYNATLPWPVRVEVDDPLSIVRTVAEQLQPIRVGIYSRDVRALLSYLERRDHLPLWLRRGVAAMTTMVSHVPAAPGSESLDGGVEALMWGGAPASKWMPITFCLMSDHLGMRMSARYLSSHYRSVDIEEFSSLIVDALSSILSG